MFELLYTLIIQFTHGIIVSILSLMPPMRKCNPNSKKRKENSKERKDITL